MQQRGRHGRIHTAGQAEYHFFLPDLSANFFDRLVDVIGHVPILPAAANVVYKARQQRLPLRGVGHFRVELHRIKTPRLVRHGGNRRGVIGSNHGKTGRQLCHLVAVAHPHIEQAVTGIVVAILNIAE